MAIQVKLPDGAVREYEQGATIEDVAGSISTGLRKNAVAGKIDGKTVDLYTPIESDGGGNRDAGFRRRAGSVPSQHGASDGAGDQADVCGTK